MFIQNLICPICRSVLNIHSNILECPKCEGQYPIVNGIPIFIEQEYQRKWTDYHIREFTPLLSNPKRNEFTCNINLTEETYYSTPLIESDYYAKYLVSCKNILDLGSGDGTFSAPLSDKGREIFCVDPSFVALNRILKRQRKNMHPINAEGTRLPFPDNFFDGILFIFVIEHLENPIDVLIEIKRVLKPTGQLVISTDSKFYYKYIRILTELAQYGHYRPNDPTHVNLMTPKELRNLTKLSGFNIDNEELVYFTRASKILPDLISETFLTSLIIQKCRPKK